MTKIEFTKKAARFVVGLSTGFTVSSALANNVPAVKTHQKVERYIGSTVVGFMASEAAESWTDRKIDEAVLWWKQNVTN